jgi:UDP-glucose 4-epimerase
MKKIIITGGLGMIGSIFAKKIIKSGYHPIIIDNLFNGSRENLEGIAKDKYTLIISDINDPKLLNKIGRKEDILAVVHCAAKHFIPFCQANKFEAVEANICGTHNILNIASELRIKKFVFISSAAVYLHGSAKFSENDELGSADIYAQTKIIGEELVESKCSKENMNFTILRLFNVYGKNNLTPHIIPAIIKQLEKGDVITLGNCESFRDYIYVEDVAEMIRLALKDSTGGVYNVGTGKGSTATDIVAIFEKLLGKKISIKTDKKLMRKIDCKYLVANAGKARKHFDWKASNNLEQGLKKLIS